MEKNGNSVKNNTQNLLGVFLCTLNGGDSNESKSNSK